MVPTKPNRFLHHNLCIFWGRFARLVGVTTVGFLHVLPTSEARGELSHALERFRRDGLSAEPLIFGGHRKPEGVVIPFELFERLLPMLEDVLIAETVRQRSTEPDQSRPLEGLMVELGFDPASFD